MFETGLHLLLESVGVKAYLELHRVSLQQWLIWSHISQNDIYICICELPSTCVPNDKLHLYAKQNKGEWFDAFVLQRQKNIDQSNPRTHLFYYIKTGTVMFTWYWPIRLRSNSNLKQNTHVTKCLNQVRLVTLVFAQKPTRKSDTCFISTTGICDRTTSMLDSALECLPGITYK